MIERNISLEEKLLDALLSNVDYTDNESVGAVLNGLSQLIRTIDGASGQREDTSEHAANIRAAVDSVARDAAENASFADTEHLANFALGKGLYEAYEVTGNEKYRELAKNIARQLDTQPRYDDGIFKGSHDNGVKRPCRTYMYTPFYMTYETKDGGKERYNDIIAQVRAYRTGVFNEYAAKLGTEASAYNVMAHFAAAMIDTMQAMDQMLYEIYHELMDYYRDAVRAIVDSKVVKGEANKADYVFGYAVLKGCRMNALHTEKYEGLVIGLVDKLLEEHSKKCDDVNVYTLAFETMFYSEALRNRDYQDYGRGKGGVLWS